MALSPAYSSLPPKGSKNEMPSFPEVSVVNFIQEEDFSMADNRHEVRAGLLRQNKFDLKKKLKIRTRVLAAGESLTGGEFFLFPVIILAVTDPLCRVERCDGRQMAEKLLNVPSITLLIHR